MLATLPRLAALSLLALCLAPHAAAQGGGFTAGELIIYSPSAGGQPHPGALLHCDPVTGTTSMFVDLFWTQQTPNTVAFDPYRQRVVFSAGPISLSEPPRLWFADAAGTLQDGGAGTTGFHSIAPAGDGRIYFRDANEFTGPLKWLDAAGTLHVLLGATGTAPFWIDGSMNFNLRGMIHDAGTNALFVASSTACPGGNINRITVRRLPLSADGARVTGPVDCAEFDVSASGEGPQGWSRMSSGHLLLGVDTNTFNEEPRLLRVDPVTLGITPFATNTIPAATAACWSAALGKALLIDTGADVLRAYGPGDTGLGMVIPTTLPMSSRAAAAPSRALPSR
jgi:hypothetical protein